MRTLRYFALFVAMGSVASSLNAEGIGWSMVNWKIRSDFPQVRRIDTETVAAWLADEKREKPVLLDVRTKAEYEVSHLPGARHVEPDASASVIDLPRARPIVTYCSVGYRSGAFADKLRKAGYSNVQNMRGSIFQWANEGRPLVRDGRPAEKAHPYNALWGKLLNAALRADVPAANDSK